MLAPTPPPDIDLDAWERTITETELRAPARLALTHFGVFEDVTDHIAGLRWDTPALGRPRRPRHGRGDIRGGARADCRASDPDEVEAYNVAAPYSQCFLGLERYWRKRSESAA